MPEALNVSTQTFLLRCFANGDPKPRVIRLLMLLGQPGRFYPPFKSSTCHLRLTLSGASTLGLFYFGEGSEGIRAL